MTERVVSEQPCEQPASASTVRPSRECRSRRRIVLRALARGGLRSISVTLRGKRRRLDPRRPVIDLGGLPRARYTARINAVTKGGRRLRLVRRYQSCAR